MKMLKRFGIGMAALLAFGAASAEARVGGWGDGKLVFASEGQFSHDNSTTASVYVATELRKNQLKDGTVIVMEAFCTIGADETEGATLTIGSHLGGTDMITAAVVMEDGVLYVRAVGIVRSTGSSGTILWTIQAISKNTTAGEDTLSDLYEFTFDTTADTVDFTLDPVNASLRRGQELGLSFDWTVADTDNTLDVDQFILWMY